MALLKKMLNGQQIIQGYAYELPAPSLSLVNKYFYAIDTGIIYVCISNSKWIRMDGLPNNLFVGPLTTARQFKALTGGANQGPVGGPGYTYIFGVYQNTPIVQIENPLYDYHSDYGNTKSGSVIMIKNGYVSIWGQDNTNRNIVQYTSSVGMHKLAIRWGNDTNGNRILAGCVDGGAIGTCPADSATYIAPGQWTGGGSNDNCQCNIGTDNGNSTYSVHFSFGFIQIINSELSDNQLQAITAPTILCTPAIYINNIALDIRSDNCPRGGGIFLPNGTEAHNMQITSDTQFTHIN